MKKSITTLAIALLAALAISFVPYGVSNAQTAGEGEIINDTCPVMGGKVDKDAPYAAVYKGKKVGFCCAGCVGTFNADPEKYMAKMQSKCMIKCPECGAEIDVMKECKKGSMSGMCPMGKGSGTSGSCPTCP